MQPRDCGITTTPGLGKTINYAYCTIFAYHEDVWIDRGVTMGRLKKFFVIAVSALMVVLLGSCSLAPQPPETTALTKDSVMVEDFEGTQTIQWLLTEKVNNPSVSANHLTRCLSYDDDLNAGNLMREIVNYAQSEGWNHPADGTLDTTTSMIAFKMDRFGDRMTMIVATDGYGCETPAKEAGVKNTLRVSITY